ncbi:MAG: hypothetical protein HY902_07005 [Deltaproteobacteria bacterium]|nr:hypothetical protein [Deltaproteobacteria bacterium]
MKRLTAPNQTSPRRQLLSSGRWPGLLALALALFALSSCDADIPVVGPKCGNDVFGPCPDALSDTDTTIADTGDDATADTEDTTPVAPVVNFYVETAVGNALEDAAITSAKIGADADLDPATVGVQVNVVVTAAYAGDGSQVSLKVGNATLGPAVLQGGKAEFKNVTIACGQAGVNMTATVTAGNLSGEKSKSLVLDCGSACQATIAAIDTPCITTDGNGDAGFQYTFTVTTASTGCTDAYLQFVDAEGQSVTTEKVSLAGASSTPITATLSSKSAGLDGIKLSIVAVVVDSQHPERGSEPSAPLAVTLSTEAPALAVQLPKAVTLGNDSDPLTPGIQLVSSGTATTLAIGGTVEIKLDGGAPTTATIGTDGTFPLTMSLTSTKTYNVAIKATNACGLSSTDSWPVQAFVDKASLAITAPVAGAVLLAKDDQNFATNGMYETNFAIDVKQSTADSEVSVFCRKAGVGFNWPDTPVGKATVAADGLISVPVVIDTALIGTAITCRVTDGFGDFAAPNAALSEEITATVAVPAPCLTVVAPAAELTITTHELPLTLATQNLKGASVIASIVSDQGVASDPQTVGTLSAIGYTGSLKLTAAGDLADGTYVISFEAVDSFGNKASDSAAVGLCGDVSRVVHIDTTGPAIAFSLPSKATLTTFEDFDVNPQVAGYQTDVTLAIADASQVCIESSTGEKACKNTAPTDTSVTFASVTLDPGVNLVNATAIDAVGNVTSAAPLVVTLVSQAPVVKMTSPKGNLTTVQDSLTFTAEVTQIGGAPVTGATTQVLIDGVAMAVDVSETAPGIYTFAVAGLSAKPSTTVQFGAGAPGAQTEAIGYSIVITVTYKSGKPTVVVTSPQNGALLNLKATECLAGSQDCATTATITLSSVEDGSAAKLDVACGTAAPQSFTGKTSGNTLTFTGISLADQSTCTLVASVTDAAGQTATSDTVTVAVDRVAPKFDAITEPSYKFTNTTLVFVASEDINSDPIDGVQCHLGINTAGLPAGATVTVTIYNDNGTVAGTFSGTAEAAIPDATWKSVAFGVISLPSGDKVKLVFTATDAAGNVGTLSVTADVNAAQPKVQIGAPTNLQEDTACTTSAACSGNLCYQGKCVASWNATSTRSVTLSVAGLPKGGLVRLCASGAGVTGADCATAGFKELASATVASNSISLQVPNSLPDGLFVLIGEASFLPQFPVTTSLLTAAPPAQKRTLWIDTVAPVVTVFAAPAAPGATAACLNEASQSAPDSAAPGGTFAFSVATSEASSVVIVGNGAKLATANATSTPANMSVTLAAEGTQVFAATATDLVGNTSAVKTLNPLVVDTQKPTGGFASPSTGKVIVGSPLDVVVTSTANDVNGATVLIKDGGVNKASEAISGGQVTFADAKWKLLSQGDHTFTADLSDVCGNTGVFGTTPSKVTVDLLPPTLAITAPAQAAKFGDADDASASLGGYQVQVTFTTTDAATWKLELASGCNSTFANCGSFKPVANGNVANPGGLEAPVLVTIPFGNGDFYKARLTGTDVNGNVTTVYRNFQVTLSGCLVSLHGLSGSGVYNTQNCATAGSDCASVTVSVTAAFVGPCGTVANLQLKKGSSEVGKAAPTAEGKATFNLNVADGDNTTVEAIALNGAAAAVGSSGALPLKADLTNPKVAFVAGQVLGVNTPAGGNTINLLGKARDLNGSTGHQLHLQLTATDNGLAGGKLTALSNTVASTTSALAASAPTLPVALSGTSQTVDIQFATLTEDATNTVTATVVDAAGNTGTGKVIVLVDWTAPAKVTLADFLTADLNPRRPMAKLSFTAVGDNGTVGTAKNYAVRYSKSPIKNQADFDTACDAGKVLFSTIGTPKPAGQADAVFVEGPDERDLSDPCKFAPMIDSGSSAYYFAVEAVDAAGNASPLSNVLSTNALRLRYANIVPGGAQKTTDMQQRIAAVGDLNGDGLGDFALGGGTSSPLCIVYGRIKFNLTDIDLSSASAYPSHVCLANPGGLGAPVGRSGDINGDGVQDLIVGVGSGTGAPRFVHVYLGQKDAAISATPALIVKNVTTPLGDGVWRATAIGNFNGDKTAGGKPLEDLAITCRAGVQSYDRVVIIPGSETFTTASPKTIDIDSPAALATYNVGTLHVADNSGAPIFGASLFGVGNMLPDVGATQYDDLAVSQASVYQAVWVLKGRPLVGATDLKVSKTMTTGNEDINAVQLAGSSAVGASAFGLYMDVVNMDNDTIPDLLVQHASSSSAGGAMYWMRGSYLSNNIGKVVSMAAETAVAGTSNLFLLAGGYRVKDFHFAPQTAKNFADRPASASPTLDVVHGLPSYTTTTNNRVIVRLGFKRPGSVISNENSFMNTDLAIYDPANKAKTNWGIVTQSALGPVSFAPIGDFNGDGVSDLVIGSTDGSLIVVF